MLLITNGRIVTMDAERRVIRHGAVLIEGNRIKDIGQKARLDIEEMLGNKVFLELWVKVRPDWAADPALLRELGLGE